MDGLARLRQPRGSHQRTQRVYPIEPTPDPASLRRLAIDRPELFPALFDTVTPGPRHRYTILAAFPEGVLRRLGNGRLAVEGAAPRVGSAAGDHSFLDALDHWWMDEGAEGAAGPHTPGDAGAATPAAPLTATPVPRLPFRGGWVLYLGYELAAEIEPTLVLPALPPQATCAAAIRVRGAIVLDHAESRAWFTSEAGTDEAAGQLQLIMQALAKPEACKHMDAAVPPARQGAPAQAEPGAPPTEDELAFRDAVLEAQRHIAAGDIYQANLSRPWCLPMPAGTGLAEAYRRLCATNPAPFAAIARASDAWLLSSSPERLVRVLGDVVETRPIAGTRRRQGGEGDESEQRELLANPKERAEHVMLIDLERNDLGRVCEAGSVVVDEFMVTESYPHLHHIVSNVRGRLRPDATPAAVLRAVFPGGTITGCPKHRCMQVIGDLEREPRGAYTGSVGYLNTDGDMDFNILIRTATLSGSELRFRAGAGIVADSDWQRELAETRTKAEGLLRAFGARA